MNRRKFIATAGAVALAGCNRSTGDKSTQTESNWPTEEAGSTVEPAERNATGGHRRADDGTSTIVTDSGEVEIVSALAAPRVGVTTAETDGNSEEIPSSEFDWYTAPEDGWMWFISVNPIRTIEGRESSLPPVGNWRAQPILEDEYNATPKLSLTATYDPDPTFVRLPLWYGGTDTRTSYGREPAPGAFTTVLVFETPSNSIDLLYGDPVEATWAFSL